MDEDRGLTVAGLIEALGKLEPGLEVRTVRSHDIGKDGQPGTTRLETVEVREIGERAYRVAAWKEGQGLGEPTVLLG